MKKRIMILISLIFIIIDILVGISYWKNYGYYLSNIDKIVLVEFFSICILVVMIVFITNIINGYGYTIGKVLIVISLVLIIFVSTYEHYNQTIHYELKLEDIESITVNIEIEESNTDESNTIKINEIELDEIEMEQFVQYFADVKYIKRNQDKKDSEVIGNYIKVTLINGSQILLNNYGDRIAVKVITKKDKESCYWMVQENISQMLLP